MDDNSPKNVVNNTQFLGIIVFNVYHFMIHFCTLSSDIWNLNCIQYKCISNVHYDVFTLLYTKNFN